MLDISEPGDKIGEKLLMLLNAKQRQELIKYLLHEKKQFGNPAGVFRLFPESGKQSCEQSSEETAKRVRGVELYQKRHWRWL